MFWQQLVWGKTHPYIFQWILCEWASKTLLSPPSFLYRYEIPSLLELRELTAIKLILAGKFSWANYSIQKIIQKDLGFISLCGIESNWIIYFDNETNIFSTSNMLNIVINSQNIIHLGQIMVDLDPFYYIWQKLDMSK